MLKTLKRLPFQALLLAFLAVGFAHRSSAVSPFSPSGKVVSNSDQIPLESPEVSAASGSGSAEDRMNLDAAQTGEGEEAATVPDPLESFNRTMFVFNDKLYFWVLKPRFRTI